MWVPVMGNQLKNKFIDILLFFILNIGDPMEPKKFLIQKTILLGLWKLCWVEKESDGGGKEERERGRKRERASETNKKIKMTDENVYFNGESCYSRLS